MRIIAKIETKTGSVVKGRKLEGIRKLGDPANFAKRYYEQGVDEIMFIDSVASLYGRPTLHDVVKKVSETVFVPLCVGGGIKSLQDTSLMFDSGADKISVNSTLFQDISILDNISNVYGSQATVVEVHAKKTPNGYMCLCEYGREYTGIKLLDWLKKLRGYRIGELHLVSIDYDGMNQGVDKDLIAISKDHIDVPLIYSGGFNPDIDDLDWLSNNIQALSIGSSLHQGKVNPSLYSERYQKSN